MRMLRHHLVVQLGGESIVSTKLADTTQYRPCLVSLREETWSAELHGSCNTIRTGICPVASRLAFPNACDVEPNSRARLMSGIGYVMRCSRLEGRWCGQRLTSATRTRGFTLFLTGPMGISHPRYALSEFWKMSTFYHRPIDPTIVVFESSASCASGHLNK